MELKPFLEQMPTNGRRDFATRCGTTLGHLKNIAYGYRACSIELAAAIEQHSGGAISAEEVATWASPVIAYFRASQTPPTQPIAHAAEKTRNTERNVR